MRAMMLHSPALIDTNPLRPETVEPPEIGSADILLEVEACAICRTDLHVVEGELQPAKRPVVPGHQVVGRVIASGESAGRFRHGDRAGIAWLRHTDGTCRYCRSGRENLCPDSRFTGYHADGGYAEYAQVAEDFAYPLPIDLDPIHVAPLLCAGIIGYSALKRSEAQPGQRLGIFGFGASAHVTIQVAVHWGCEVYVITRGDRHRALAEEMGATWVGRLEDRPPSKLDAAIIFAPAGQLVPPALEMLDRGGTLALAGVYMTDVPSLQYERHLFYERSLRSVTANARQDGEELLRLAVEIPIQTHVEVFSLAEANEALQRLKSDQIKGSGVLAL